MCMSFIMVSFDIACSCIPLNKRMDPMQEGFSDSVSSILERKVRNWLSGVIDDMRRSSPVQQWLDSLPETHASDTSVSEIEDICSGTDINLAKQETTNESQSEDCEQEVSISEETVVETTKKDVCDDNILSVPSPNVAWKRNSLESGLLTNQQNDKNIRKRLQRDYSVQSEGCNQKLKNPLLRDHSLQSDASGSSGSSVLNVLGARKVDAESVLLALGFGPSEKQQKLQRIPDRFLAPSKLNGISTEQFIKEEQHSMRMHDCGIFGYRGLTGNPHVPPSTIVAKIMECILRGDVHREEAIMRARHSIADMRSPAATHAHLASKMHNN